MWRHPLGIAGPHARCRLFHRSLVHPKCTSRPGTLHGYANVFDQFGRWEFYSGSVESFAYDDRTKHFEDLVARTLQRIASSLSDTPSIYFHYSAKFSHEDRDA